MNVLRTCLSPNIVTVFTFEFINYAFQVFVPLVRFSDSPKRRYSLAWNKVAYLEADLTGLVFKQLLYVLSYAKWSLISRFNSKFPTSTTLSLSYVIPP